MGRIKKVIPNESKSSKRLSTLRSAEEENEESIANGVQLSEGLKRNREVKNLKSKVEKKKKVKNTGVSIVKQELKEKLKVKLQPNVKLVTKTKMSNKRGKRNNKKNQDHKVFVEKDTDNTSNNEQIKTESEKISSPMTNEKINSLPSVMDENQNESKDAEEDDQINLKAAKKLKTKTKKISKKKMIKSKHNSTKKAKKEMPKRAMSPVSQDVLNEVDNSSCRICHQLLDDDLKFYNGVIENEGEEKDISNLMMKSNIEDNDEVLNGDKSFYKLNSFSIFCKNGHLCPFESEFLSDKEDILIAGTLKSTDSSHASLKNEDHPKNLGPITDWWMLEYNSRAAIVCSTKNGDFILSQPSKEYAAYMKSVNLNLFITKKIIEYLITSPTANYEDLLSKLERIPVLKDEPRFSEDMLLHQMPFIVRQLIMFDQTARPHEPLLTATPCIRRLINLAGIKLSDIQLPKANLRKFEQINIYREKLLAYATRKKRRETTEALAELANNPFLLEEKPARSNARRCGACENCQRPACNACLTCERREPERCLLRRCLLQEIQEANEEDSTCISDVSPILESAKVKLSLTAYADALGKFPCYASSFSWLGEPVALEENGSVYYKSMLLNGEKISEGEYVLAGAAVLRIAYLWRDETGTAQMHVSHLWRARDSPLGSLGEHRELLHTSKCCVLPVTCVLAKLAVTERRAMENWDKGAWSETTPQGFYCQRSFDPETGRFEDLPLDCELPDDQTPPYRFCANCVREKIEAERNTPYPIEPLEEFEDIQRFGAVKYRGEEYRIGSCVYLKPRTLYFKYPMLNNHVKTRGERIKYIDEEKYPEYYRKIEEEEQDKHKSDSKLVVGTPFDIGYIMEIFTRSEKLFIKIKKMYRPENTHKRESFSRQADFNMLYWSNEEYSVLFSYVVQKCFLSHLKNVKSGVTEWTLQGPDRFYFSQMYENKEFYSVDKKDYACKSEVYDEPTVYSKADLKTLNIFAGCGGLSLGLRQSGVAKICWAIEPDTAAALTFQSNNSDAIVINEDCNEVLKKFVGGEKMCQNQSLPLREEVDLLCATLPNEFITDTTFTNSKFATFVSYCEVYRPIYFILETDEILAKKNTLLKLTIACLLSIGYQVSFDVLQVGCFGVPQNKKKLVIFGAAPGRKLPKSPKPLHVFPKVHCCSGVVIDNKKYVQNYETMGAAPYRLVTIRDALADLPNINVGNRTEMTIYSGQITSYFQKMMRLNKSEMVVYNHICKDLGPLIQARISQIPLTVGSDWRNLPNIEMKLSDGSVTKKLIYKYDDKETGKNSLDDVRGVCACSSGQKCSLGDRQENSLIPWHLVHSAKQNHHWSGLYSRLQWEGFFNGTITNPEPLSEQNPVIHPNQHRVVSVRECARAQGFPDNFLFPKELQILDKYRIIGTATSPHFAFALGCEIARSIVRKSK